ncbi:hypothetical protein [Streptomyces sp. ICBB 8177]|uniref:hypothetical protein n=1 Tax=Streptomyces sp. ICBB 8177 TaxID=563922 RepID=UPI000D680850|nr:hypothetical protein [Streptomyces sp. ICBB 8177]PWI42543.1 hypothetical protein CK485_09380 [Streptomyces sp. ICBB 8177]
MATGAAVAGGVMLVTVGVDKAFHEHWSEDIHDHGVPGGIAHGTADVASGSCKTVWGAMKGLGSGIASVF